MDRTFNLHNFDYPLRYAVVRLVRETVRENPWRQLRHLILSEFDRRRGGLYFSNSDALVRGFLRAAVRGRRAVLDLAARSARSMRSISAPGFLAHAVDHTL